MASLIAPNLKDEQIVCQKPCSHRDCAATRRQWEHATCKLCGKPVKHPERFYFDNKAIVHAICLEELVDSRRA